MVARQHSSFANEADETVAAHVALRRALVPNPRAWIHNGEGVIASTADIDCPTCNTIYVHDSAARPDEVRDLVARLAARNRPFQLTIRGSLAPRYAPVLEAAGLSHHADLPMMTVTPGEFRPAPAAEALDLFALAPDAEPYHLELVAWGLDMSLKGISHLMSPANLASPAWTSWVGEVDGVLAVTGSAIRGELGSGLISIVTDPRFGRRGFAAALTSRAIADSFAQGSPRVFLHSSAQGFGVYQKLGFRTVEQLSLFGPGAPAH